MIKKVKDPLVEKEENLTKNIKENEKKNLKTEISSRPSIPTADHSIKLFYKFHEGYSNAVLKSVKIDQL